MEGVDSGLLGVYGNLPRNLPSKLRKHQVERAKNCQELLLSPF